MVNLKDGAYRVDVRDALFRSYPGHHWIVLRYTLKPLEGGDPSVEGETFQICFEKGDAASMALLDEICKAAGVDDCWKLCEKSFIADIAVCDSHADVQQVRPLAEEEHVFTG